MNDLSLLMNRDSQLCFDSVSGVLSLSVAGEAPILVERATNMFCLHGCQICQSASSMTKQTSLGSLSLH